MSGFAGVKHQPAPHAARSMQSHNGSLWPWSFEPLIPAFAYAAVSLKTLFFSVWCHNVPLTSSLTLRCGGIDSIHSGEGPWMSSLVA